MPFRCRLCRAESYEPVTVRRPDGSLYRSTLLACVGCSAVFLDPDRFSLNPPPLAEPVAHPQWESRRTAARRNAR